MYKHMHKHAHACMYTQAHAGASEYHPGNIGRFLRRILIQRSEPLRTKSDVVQLDSLSAPWPSKSYRSSECLKSRVDCEKIFLQFSH